MNRTLTLISILALCLAGSYGLGLLIGQLMGGSSFSSGVDLPRMLLSVLVSASLLVPAFFINTILHEAGHLVCGLMTGYGFLSFRIFNLTLQKEDDGLHWKRFKVGGTLGQCLMVPPANEEVPCFWYNAGGILANLLVAIACSLLLLFFDMPVLPSALCIMLAFTAMWLLITNGIPADSGRIPNDGTNILLLRRHPGQRKYFRNMLAVNAWQAHGKRLSEMPEGLSDSKPLTAGATVMEMAARNIHYCLLMDQMRLDEARRMAEEFDNPEIRVPMVLKQEFECDRLLLELATLNRDEVVGKLWTGKLQKHARTFSRYSPMKSALLCAFELIRNGNEPAAQEHYLQVKSQIDDYVQPGEAKSAVAIMEHLFFRVSGKAAS